MDSQEETDLAKAKLIEIRDYLTALPAKFADLVAKLVELQNAVDTNDVVKAELQTHIDKLVADQDELETLIGSAKDAKDAADVADGE